VSRQPQGGPRVPPVAFPFPLVQHRSARFKQLTWSHSIPSHDTHTHTLSLSLSHSHSLTHSHTLSHQGSHGATTLSLSPLPCAFAFPSGRGHASDHKTNLSPRNHKRVNFPPVLQDGDYVRNPSPSSPITAPSPSQFCAMSFRSTPSSQSKCY